MKVLITPRSFGKTDPRAFEILRNAGFELLVNDTGGILDRESMGVYLADCDGVVLGVDPLDAGVLAKAPKLKAIAKYGVGVDNIDLAECERRSIKVSRTVGANSNAVADFAFALMLAVARRVVENDAMCRRRDWSKVTSLDVYGKTLGLLGLGAIGKCMAARARGFGMRIMAYDVFWNEQCTMITGAECSTPEDIFREADFISLHVPLTDQTRGMIGREQLAMMKPTAIVINTARGGLIDEAALLEALRNKTIYGAGIDAFAQEPPVEDAWFSLDNLVMGSHSAGSTAGATQMMGRMAAESLVRDLTGMGS